MLGVKAVLAESFERIHRSNLVGMGVLPLEFLPGQTSTSLGLDGSEVYTIYDLHPFKPGKRIRISGRKVDKAEVTIEAIMRINTAIEAQYFKDGGIMNTILLGLIG